LPAQIGATAGSPMWSLAASSEAARRLRADQPRFSRNPAGRAPRLVAASLPDPS